MQSAPEIILDYLQLIRSENLGPKRVQGLLARFGSAKAALAALQHSSAQFLCGGAKKPIRLISRAEAEEELNYAEKIGARFITWEDEAYPPYMRESYSPPPVLAVKGNAALLSRPSVALVGSRNASAIGSRLSSRFARALGEAGFAIVSGFARGIDTYAHQAALPTGTIAVFAGGVDHIYPPENKKLYHDILAKGGVCISEMPLRHKPRAADFPRRNRLIAALPLGLLVIEASERSGSLISARYAAEAGRIVFAAPGSPLDPRAKGTNGLIKNGASLVDDPQDIVEMLAPLLAPQNAAPPSRLLFGGGSVPVCTDDEEYAEEEPFCAEQMRAMAENAAPPRAKAESAAKAETHGGIAAPAPVAPAAKRGTDNAERAEDDGELSEEEKQRLEQSLSPTPIAIDSLAYATQIPLPRLYLGLMELELAGRLIRHNGGMVSALPA